MLSVEFLNKKIKEIDKTINKLQKMEETESRKNYISHLIKMKKEYLKMFPPDYEE